MSKLDDRWNRIVKKIHLIIEKNKKLEEVELTLRNKINELEKNYKSLTEENSKLNKEEQQTEFINQQNYIKELEQQQEILNENLEQIKIENHTLKEALKVKESNAELVNQEERAALKQQIEQHINKIDNILEMINP
ncbi:MAG: hypothetical protein KDC60_04860 [Bacteroidetes bacterium]|nr:hypothetical protein [Bacteroidota bacterium]